MHYLQLFEMERKSCCQNDTHTTQRYHLCASSEQYEWVTGTVWTQRCAIHLLPSGKTDMFPQLLGRLLADSSKLSLLQELPHPKDTTQPKVKSHPPLRAACLLQ